MSIPGKFPPRQKSITVNYPAKEAFGSTRRGRFEGDESDKCDEPGPGILDSKSAKILDFVPRNCRELPGPGQYEVCPESHKADKNRYGRLFLPVTDFERMPYEPVRWRSPGPAEYFKVDADLKKAEKKQRKTKISSGEFPFSSTAERGFRPRLDTPCVGKYDVRLSLFDNKGSLSLLRSEKRWQGYSTFVPGPGTYFQDDTLSAPVSSKPIRHADCLTAQSEIALHHSSSSLQDSICSSRSAADCVPTVAATSSTAVTASAQPRSSLRSAGSFRGPYLGKIYENPVPYDEHAFGSDLDRFKHSYLGRLDIIGTLPGPGRYHVNRDFERFLPVNPGHSLRSGSPKMVPVKKSPACNNPGPGQYQLRLTLVKPTPLQNVDGKWVP